MGTAGHAESLSDAVVRGLTSERKSLPCHLFYDERGSRLFERITQLDEYYPTRADEEILRDRAREIVAATGPPIELVELGSGSSTKTAPLVDAILELQETLDYRPIDVSRAALEWGADSLLPDRPELRVRAVCGDYEDGLARLGPTTRRRLVLWLGSSIGNLTRPDAAAFLRRARRSLAPGDAFLIGIDLRKDRAVLEAAYDDAEGVTAEFNKNLLHRLRDELGAHVDPDAFVHRAVYDVEDGTVRMFLESLRDQIVRIESLGLEVPFTAGERVHTEDSTKYSLDEIARLAEDSGTTLERTWLDGEARFSESLFRRG
ncbi:MAG: L-histidine N(alpha)-methyltransferase [Planctomycetes bacterium]|nr:L-histidine N(alpha)-methyltransferase [Planctomycetota bacterium]